MHQAVNVIEVDFGFVDQIADTSDQTLSRLAQSVLKMEEGLKAQKEGMASFRGNMERLSEVVDKIESGLHRFRDNNSKILAKSNSLLRRSRRLGHISDDWHSRA